MRRASFVDFHMYVSNWLYYVEFECRITFKLIETIKLSVD